MDSSWSRLALIIVTARMTIVVMTITVADQVTDIKREKVEEENFKEGFFFWLDIEMSSLYTSLVFLTLGMLERFRL